MSYLINMPKGTLAIIKLVNYKGTFMLIKTTYKLFILEKDI